MSDDSTGHTRSVPKEDFVFLVETLFLGTLVEQALQTLKDAKAEGFEGLEAAISTLDTIMEGRAERVDRVLSAILPPPPAKAPAARVTFKPGGAS